jgi:hypothetical protein
MFCYVRPDMITPNGLNVKRMYHEFQNLHQVIIKIIEYQLCLLSTEKF